MENPVGCWMPRCPWPAQGQFTLGANACDPVALMKLPSIASTPRKRCSEIRVPSLHRPRLHSVFCLHSECFSCRCEAAACEHLLIAEATPPSGDDYLQGLGIPGESTVQD